jgi:UDP-N-acetylglucosamine 2-epimerase (non-hydrolysing)
MKSSNKWKITTFVGTRPEIIRLSEVIKLCDLTFNHRLIHSGQNSASFLSDIFFKDLGVREPDEIFDCHTETFATFLGDWLPKVEKELTKNRPDGILILGDTNTSYASVIARRLQIPVYHLEAGNRSFDSNVPEEVNRRIVDHASDFNLAYTEFARRNLISEGLHPRNVTVVGSPLNEVLKSQSEGIQRSEILKKLGLTKNTYLLASLHRQENVNSKSRLMKLIAALEAVHLRLDLPIVLSLHPRTDSMLKEHDVNFSEGIRSITPVGFHDYINLQQNSKLVLSDSGSISEEAAILGFPAITVRDSMERPEALEAGSVVLSGTSAESLVRALDAVLQLGNATHIPSDYQITDTSRRVVSFVLSTLPNHSRWTGLHKSN